MCEMKLKVLGMNRKTLHSNQHLCLPPFSLLSPLWLSPSHSPHPLLVLQTLGASQPSHSHGGGNLAVIRDGIWAHLWQVVDGSSLWGCQPDGAYWAYKGSWDVM